MALVFATDPDFHQRPTARQLPTPSEGAQRRSVSAGRAWVNGRASAGAPFEDLASIIPRNQRRHFTTPKKAEEFGVPEGTIHAIDELLQGLHLGYSFRLTYESAVESLILKCTPSVPHETAGWTFCTRVLIKIDAIPGHTSLSVAAVGAGRFGVPGQRSKEADAALVPATRPPTGWPSLVFEVGCSESLPALRCDARWWLVNSDGQTRMAVIIKVTGSPHSLHLETWEMVPNPNAVPNPNGRSTRQTPATVPGCTQEVDIDEVPTVRPAGFELRIPYLSIFDAARPNALDITFTENELSVIASHIYGRMV